MNDEATKWANQSAKQILVAARKARENEGACDKVGFALLLIDLFSLYVLSSYFRPRDVSNGIFLVFFQK